MSSVKFLLLLDIDLIVGLMASSLPALVVFSAATFWLWKRPPRTPALLAALYLLAASVFCVVAIASDSDYLLVPAAVLSFPWSFLLIILGSILEVDLGASIVFPGLMINAFLIHLIGKAVKNRNEQHLLDSVKNARLSNK